MKRSNRRMPLRAVCVLGLVTAFLSSGADAEMRVPIPDSEVVTQADLIVLARPLEDSFHYIRTSLPDGRAVWEPRVRLAVAEVLRGDEAAAEVEVILAEWSHVFAAPGEGPPEGMVYSAAEVRRMLLVGGEGFDWSDPEESSADSVLLFLRRPAAAPETSDRPVAPGLPLYVLPGAEAARLPERQAYLLTYLEEDPEPALLHGWGEDPELAPRVQEYREQRAIERAAAEPDLDRRAELLAAAVVHHAGTDGGERARRELLTLGPQAGAALAPYFDVPENLAQSWVILSLWRELDYREAVDMLLPWLDTAASRWAAEDLAPGWTRGETRDPRLTALRVRRETLIYVLYALGDLGDERVRDPLERTRRLWQGIPDGDEVVQACTAALQRLDRRLGPEESLNSRSNFP